MSTTLIAGKACTEPNHVPSVAFFNEFVPAAILMIAVSALGDDTGLPPGANMHAFVVGTVITVLIYGSAYQTGLAMNPARDFGPRLAALMFHYPTSIFTNRKCWFIW